MNLVNNYTAKALLTTIEYELENARPYRDEAAEIKFKFKGQLYEVLKAAGFKETDYIHGFEAVYELNDKFYGILSLKDDEVHMAVSQYTDMLEWVIVEPNLEKRRDALIGEEVTLLELILPEYSSKGLPEYSSIELPANEQLIERMKEYDIKSWNNYCKDYVKDGSIEFSDSIPFDSETEMSLHNWIYYANVEVKSSEIEIRRCIKNDDLLRIRVLVNDIYTERG